MSVDASRALTGESLVVQKKSEALLQSLGKSQAAEIFATKPKQQRLPATYFMTSYYQSFTATGEMTEKSGL